METSKVISTDKAKVIIQEDPQAAKDSIIFIDGQEVGGRKHNTLTEFFKAQPTALGTVQITIGVIVLLIGIVLTIIINYTSIVTYSGITYWGSFIHISAGSLSVAAQKKFSLCLVKASLVMNVVSAVTAGIAIILMGIEIKLIINSSESYNLRTLGILLLFTIPQFIISIFISAFACKATTRIYSTVVNVALN